MQSVMQSLATALESSWQASIGSSVLIGCLCHQLVLPFEIDNEGWMLVFGYLGATTTLFLGYSTMTQFGTFMSAVRTCVMGASMLTGLSTSILAYRAFFHRLRRFPGPFTARLSKFDHVRTILRTKQKYHLHVQGLHKQYGDFVRTGPRELSITRLSAINTIYGPSSKCEKGTWYDQNSGNQDNVGIENLRDRQKHRMRRRAWDMGLGFRAITTYETRIKDKVDMLMARLGNPGALNITQHSIFYSFDVMGEISLSQDFGMLRTGKEHPAVASLHTALSIAGVVTTVPWLMNMLRVVPGATGPFEKFANWCYEQLRLKRLALKAEQEANGDPTPRDVMTWLINAQENGDKSAPPTEAAIQEDARTLISAGSDTVAIVFTNFIYFMIQNPDAYKKLQSILNDEFPQGLAEWTYARAKAIKYIDYLIFETLRLHPAVPMGFLRQTPAEGIQVDEVYIPGDTIVSVPTWTIHRDSRYYDRAEEFVPERWETLSPDTAAFLAFQRGQFACSGKQVALMQLRMLISNIAMKYNVDFAPGEDGKSFVDGQKEALMLWLPPLHVVFTAKDGDA